MPANWRWYCAITWLDCAIGWICYLEPMWAPSSTSIRCCARSTVTPNRAPPTGTQRSLAGPVPAGHRSASTPPVITGARLRAGRSGSDLIDGSLAYIPSRTLRRQLRLDPLRSDRPQSAARRGNTGRSELRRGPRCNAAAQDRPHSRPPDPTATTTHPAPAQLPAIGASMASLVGQHHQSPHR